MRSAHAESQQGQSPCITAGASSPEFLVEQVIERLQQLGGESTVVDSFDEVDEGMHFKIPSELRAS